MGRRSRHRCLLGLLLLGAAALDPGLRAARADQGWWGDLDKGQGVRLEDVLAAPERHRGRALTFPCVFHRAEREFNPLRTRFNAERYDNFSVWPDGSPIWVEEAFTADFPFVYVARSHPQRDALLRLEPFTRIELTARIETVLDGHPFLEVTSWRATGHRFGQRLWDLLRRAEAYAQPATPEGLPLAADILRRALDLQPDLAPVYDLRIRARLAEVLRQLGRGEEAEQVLAARGAASSAAGVAPEGAAGAGPVPPGGTGGPLPPSAQAPPPGPGSSIGSPDGEAGAHDPLTSPLAPAPGAPDTASPGSGGPAVVDPPLPPPPPGGAPPPRRPRLAGVR